MKISGVCGRCARATGASPAVFSRQFQRMMGMTPTDYRAKTSPS